MAGDFETWKLIKDLRKQQVVLRARLLRQRDGDCENVSEVDQDIGSDLTELERSLMELLLNPLTEYPLTPIYLCDKLPQVRHSAIRELLDKFSCQGLIKLDYSSVTVISSTDRLIAIAGTRADDTPPSKRPKTVEEEIEYILMAPSIRELENKKMGSEISELLGAKSVKERMVLEKFQSIGGSQLREFCEHKTKEDCRKERRGNRTCNKLHFKKIIQGHTDENLGDCSFLNTCFHMDTCKFVHYEIETPADDLHSTHRSSKMLSCGLLQDRPKLTQPQWVNCDIRRFDWSVLGKFAVVMADPPWDIHMELPYGTMSDDEMRQLNIPALQDNGYLFLWVTGRAMELGRECLTLWGYDRVDELVWVKTNQLQRLIRTGRTGHWINHGKEHCLVGMKGDCSVFNRGINCDVIVAEVRATSHKPDEIYGVIERLSPGTRKIELFGRQHNCQPNWVTLGNQLDGVHLVDPEVAEAFWTRYPTGP